MPRRILRLAESTYDRKHRMRWHIIDHVLSHRQRADIVSQLRAMRADVMHGQNVKHRGYTPDIHIRLNNPELSEAVLSDCFKSSSASVSAQSLSFATLVLTLFRNASLLHGFASPLLIPSASRSRSS